MCVGRNLYYSHGTKLSITISIIRSVAPYTIIFDRGRENYLMRRCDIMAHA